MKTKPKAKGLTGIGFPPEGIAVAHVVRNKDGSPELQICEFQPCDDEAARRKALNELVKKHGLAGAPSVAVMERGTYSLLQVEAPDVPSEELRAAVRWRIKDLIDFHIDDAVIDVFDIPGQSERGRPRMMYVVAARTSVVQERIELLEASGVELTAIDITELALRNLASLLPEDHKGQAFLYPTAHDGLILLMRQSSLYLARTLGLGTQALRESALEGEGIGPRRTFDTIVLEVQRSLDYYESYFSQPTVAQVVVAPSEPDLPELVRHLNEGLGLPVRTLDLNALVENPEPLSGPRQAQCLTAVGAALRTEQKAL